MTYRFSPGMTEAVRLTQAGQLTEATALIRALLQNPGKPADAPAQQDSGSGDLIEGTATRLDPVTPSPEPQRGAARKRQSLRETLREIAAGGMPAQSPLSGPDLELPEGAAFALHTHRSARAARDYRLYVPSTARQVPMPLIVMLHGCTQTPEDFAAGTGMNVLAEEFGCLVAYPAQPSGANSSKCWNWFRPEDQGRDRGEPALIAGIIRDILRTHPVDPARVYVAGLSAGGAAAAIVAAAYPDLIAAVGVHSGLPVGAARDVPSAFAAMRSGAGAGARAAGTPMPTITLHGDADTTVHPKNGAAVAARARSAYKGLKKSVVQGTSEGGRAYRRTCHAAQGVTVAEEWEVAGAGHAWAGGRAAGSYTDPAGPDASREMVRFFLSHRLRGA